MIALIAFSQLKIAPYVQSYINICKKNNLNYIVITKDPDIDLTKKEGEVYHVKFNRRKTIVGKFFSFLQWGRTVKKIIKKEQISKIVFFTIPCTFIFKKTILKNNDKKIIVDVRDYWDKLKNPFFRSVFGKIQRKSDLTVISSEGFLQWLPVKSNFTVMHNLPDVICDYKNDGLSKKEIVIGYLGNISYYHENCRLADALKGQGKFRLFFAGYFSDKNNIKDYCLKNNIQNIRFSGEFDNSEKFKLYKDIDIINAVYGNNSLLVTTALPNKLYDALIYQKPIVVSKGTYLGNVVERYKIGLAVDVNKDDLYNKINTYVNEFDKEEFCEGCHNLLKKVETEQKRTIDIILDIIG